MENFDPLHLLPELVDAIKKGYSVPFLLLANGLIRCLSNPTRYYDFSEVQIVEVITCSLIPANLYLLATLDGLYQGTAIEFVQDSI